MGLKEKVIAGILIFFASAVGFAAETTAATKLTITGSSTIAPLMTEVAKKYESLHPGVRVDVQSGGSARGVSDARKGTADIGMVSRKLGDEEKDLVGYAIAKDGVCIILNKANSVQELADQQIIDIYTGKITNWKAVGGKDAPITVVNKAEGRSTLELFLHYFKLKNSDIKASVVIGDNEQGIKTVAGNPNAIGYVSVGTAEYSEKNKVAIKTLPTGGVAATTKNVELEKFPFSRPLNLVTFGKVGPLAQDFIKFATSKEVAPLIEEQYFVPLKK